MLLALALVLSAAAPPPNPAGDALANPRGVQAVARATVEILSAARATAMAGPSEPQRQVRRSTDGKPLIEFE